MTEESFWEIIAKAQREVGDLDKYADAEGMEGVQATLETLSPEEILAFDKIVTAKYLKAFTWDLLGAAHILAGGGCGDDGFMDFRSELVFRGREVYEAALIEPDTLADIPGPPLGCIEGWLYLGSQAYESVTGDPLPEYEINHPREPVGTKWKESELPQRFPKLWAKFGNN